MSKNVKSVKSGTKTYNPSFGFWTAKSGNGFTVSVNEKLLETLQKAQIGGKLYLQEVPADRIEENESLPNFRVTIFPPNEKTAEDSL